MTGFVRASELYDIEAGEPLQFDWTNLQPLAESQAEVERVVAAVKTDGGDANDRAGPSRTPRQSPVQ